MKDISIQSVSKTYSSGSSAVHALSSVDIEISWGEFVGVAGKSGAGKSTLLSIAGGMMSPDSGKYTVDEIDVYSLSSERRADFRREYLGFVFQSFHLMPYLTASENVMLPLVVTGMNKKEKIRRASEALDRVGLSGKYNRLPDQMSGGENERVAIARAIVNNPRILLADEPTGNLDSKTGAGIISLFRELHSDGMTIIMVSHSEEYINLTERKIQLSDGRIIGEQPH